MLFSTLSVEKKSEFVLLVTLNRPDVSNAINSIMMQELLQLWQILQNNSEKLRCVILTGKGKSFCAGADLKERLNIPLNVWKKQHAILRDAIRLMLACPIPIITAVNGAAFGGGLELILASDFAYAAATAKFAQSEVKVGIMPGAFGTQNLPRACGLRRAKELTFTGEAFSAEDALRWNIINKICEPEKLMDEVFFTAHKICENAPLAIAYAKNSLNMSRQLDFNSGCEFETATYRLLLETKDRKEGIQSFNEKRKPHFVGE